MKTKVKPTSKSNIVETDLTISIEKQKELLSQKENAPKDSIKPVFKGRVVKKLVSKGKDLSMAWDLHKENAKAKKRSIREVDSESEDSEESIDEIPATPGEPSTSAEKESLIKIAKSIPNTRLLMNHGRSRVNPDIEMTPYSIERIIKMYCSANNIDEVPKLPKQLKIILATTVEHLIEHSASYLQFIHVNGTAKTVNFKNVAILEKLTKKDIGKYIDWLINFDKELAKACGVQLHFAEMTFINSEGYEQGLNVPLEHLSFRNDEDEPLTNRPFHLSLIENYLHRICRHSDDDGEDESGLVKSKIQKGVPQYLQKMIIAEVFTLLDKLFPTFGNVNKNFKDILKILLNYTK